MKLVKKLSMNKRTVILAVLVVLFVVSGAGLVFMRHDQEVKATNKVIAEAADDAAKVPKKTSGLYFEDKSTLPTTYVPGQNLTLSFTIENQEGKTLDYPYTVTFNDKQVAAHSVNLATNTTKKVSELFTMPTDQTDISVKITLTNQSKFIQLTLTKVAK